MRQFLWIAVCGFFITACSQDDAMKSSQNNFSNAELKTVVVENNDIISRIESSYGDDDERSGLRSNGSIYFNLFPFFLPWVIRMKFLWFVYTTINIGF